MKGNFFLPCCIIQELPGKVQKMKWRKRTQWRGSLFTELCYHSALQKHKDQVPGWVPGFKPKFLYWTFLRFRSNPNFWNFGEAWTWMQRLISGCFCTEVFSLDVVFWCKVLLQACFQFEMFSYWTCFFPPRPGGSKAALEEKGVVFTIFHFFTSSVVLTYKYLAMNILDSLSSPCA